VKSLDVNYRGKLIYLAASHRMSGSGLGRVKTLWEKVQILAAVVSWEPAHIPGSTMPYRHEGLA
jgi:hypothetical protein